MKQFRESGSAVLVHDLSQGRAYRADAAVAAQELRSAPAPTDQRYKATSVAKWMEANWGPSLVLHLAAHHQQYADAGDQGPSRAVDTLAEYLARDECPPRFQPPLNEVLALGPGHGVLATPDKVLLERRTLRRFSRRTVDLETLSHLLWGGLARVRQAMSWDEKVDDAASLRVSHGTALEWFIIDHSESLLHSGNVGYYSVKDHAIHGMDLTISRREYSELLYGQYAPQSASLSLLFLANTPRYSWIYRHCKAYVNLFLECGRVAQQMLAWSTALGLSALPTPAINEGRALESLRLDTPALVPVYSLTFGYGRQSSC